jgi:hypothetical protein
MLLTNGVFWDDWRIIFDDNRASFYHYFYKGQPFFIVLNAMGRLAGGSLYFTRLLVFAAMYIVTACFYLILRKVPHLTRRDAFFSAAIFAVFPQYFSKMCLIIFPYTGAVAIFMVAFYLVTRGYHRRGIWQRVLVLALFFCSFTLGSLLMFYLVPFVYLLMSTVSWPKDGARGVIRFLKGHLDFLFLPIIFQAFTTIVFPAREWFKGYNHVGSEFVPALPHLLSQSIQVGFTNVIRDSLRGPYWWCVLALLAVSVIRGWRLQSSRLVTYSVGLAISFALIFLGIFPYAAVGKMVEFYYVGDRNAVLELFGSALAIYFGFSLLFIAAKSEVFRTIAVLSCIAIFMAKDTKIYFSFLRAAIKQDSIIALIPNYSDFEKGRTFRFVDRTDLYIPKYTPYQQPQLTGLLNWVFRTRDRCAHSSVDECLDVARWDLRNTTHIITSYKPEPDRYSATIDYGPERLGVLNTFRLTFLKIFAKGHYDAIVPEVLRLNVAPIVPPS